ncbi:MAG: NupC/NupG family nucleoside CNT transporter [Xanthomonadaceae bacterium]|jgi:CNT family concentrative nucleoside transporter|nr:NupC/NupG family nucleoside CNT transporter [Xanthomonadaceae bacterium]
MQTLFEILFGLFGLSVLVAIAWLFSNNKGRVEWKLVATGVALQIAFAALVLLVPGGREVFGFLAKLFVQVLDFTKQGSQFVFGPLMSSTTADGQPAPWGFIVAFQVLPTIIFFAALMGALYHLGVMQKIVKGIAWAITRVMNVSGAETTSVTASIFVGQTEAPLTVKPYIGRMTGSELLTMMIGGMAHIAGGVLAAYVLMLGGGDQESMEYFAKHLLTASIMAAPATLVIAKILIPETGEPLTRGTVKIDVEKHTVNVIDGAATGAADGVRLAINVGGMLIAFIAIIAMINAPLAWLGGIDFGGTSINALLTGDSGTPVVLSLQVILGFALAPIAWVIGVPWNEAQTVGGLIGQKIVINEFVAYLALADVKETLSEHSILIATYALCGFANFASIAIQIGGIGGLAPERRGDLARFGLRAVLGGTIATLMTATIAGVLSKAGGIG